MSGLAAGTEATAGSHRVTAGLQVPHDPAQSQGKNQASDEMPSVRRVSAAFKSDSCDGKFTFAPGKETGF